MIQGSTADLTSSYNKITVHFGLNKIEMTECVVWKQPVCVHLWYFSIFHAFPVWSAEIFVQAAELSMTLFCSWRSCSPFSSLSWGLFLAPVTNANGGENLFSKLSCRRYAMPGLSRGRQPETLVPLVVLYEPLESGQLGTRAVG